MSTTFIQQRPARIAALVYACILAAIAAACTVADTDIRTNVETQVAADPVTAGSNVTVTVTQGAVRIDGETPTRAAQTRIVEITRAIKGVKDVVVDLALSDEAIAAAIKAAVAADPMVGKVPLTVECEDGLVKLRSDQTNKDERTQIVALTKAVDGVRTVEDWMR